MNWTVGDILSIATGGWFKQLTGDTPPSTPTVAVENDGTGTGVTVTVAGDSDATHTVYYQRATDAALTVGESRTGSGAIAQTGLTDRTWTSFIVVATRDGLNSLPSALARVYVCATVATDSVLERIAQQIAAKLGELVTSEAAAVVERPKSTGVTASPQHLGLVLFQDDPSEDEPTYGMKRWIQPFSVYAYIRPSDSDTTPIEQLANNFRAEIEKKLLEDVTFGGLALDARIQAPRGFVQTDGFEGVEINFDVHYRTLETNPFSVGG